MRRPRCGNKVSYLEPRQWHWQCEQCAPDGYRFSHIAGTIFENTNKPLRDWFKVAHLMLARKKGMSALQITRYMGFGSYKTAWLMCHKIRTALIEDVKQLGGIVEVDEFFIGGKDKNKHWDGERRNASIARRTKPRHRCGAAQGQRGCVSDGQEFTARSPDFCARNGFGESVVCSLPTKAGSMTD